MHAFITFHHFFPRNLKRNEQGGTYHNKGSQSSKLELESPKKTSPLNPQASAEREEKERERECFFSIFFKIA
jgi:hypothetical protein